MLSRNLINRVVVLIFMVLIGYSFAKNIQSGSWIGTALCGVSLLAGIYFLYLVANLNKEMEKKDAA